MSFHYVDTYGAGFREREAPLHRYGDPAAWSSMNEQTGIVVLAMWHNLFELSGDTVIFNCFQSGADAWHQHLSAKRAKRNRIRSQHLQTLRTKPRVFRAFITISPFLDEYLKVAKSMVVDHLELELMDFDHNTCEHRAKVIHPTADEIAEALNDMRTRFEPTHRPDD